MDFTKEAVNSKIQERISQLEFLLSKIPADPENFSELVEIVIETDSNRLRRRMIKARISRLNQFDWKHYPNVESDYDTQSRVANLLNN